MAITHTFRKHQVLVTQEIPDHPNTICKVVWSYVFTDGTYESIGQGVTALDTARVIADQAYGSLLNADSATDADIENWVRADLDWNNYETLHTGRVNNAQSMAGAAEYFNDGSLPSWSGRTGGLVGVPRQVTMRQARLALLQQGFLSVVEDAINLIPDPDQTKVRTEWEYAATVQRDSEWVATLQPALGLTDQQMDDLFNLAASL